MDDINPLAGTPIQAMLNAMQQFSQMGQGGQNPLGQLGQLGQPGQLGQMGQAGKPVNFSKPSSFQNNPAVNAAMGNLGAFGGAAMLPFMGGGSNPMSNPLSNGFSITHVSVQPGKGSANERYQRMTARRQQQQTGQATRAQARRNARSTWDSPYAAAFKQYANGGLPASE